MSLQIGLFGTHDPQLIEAVQSMCTLLGGELVLLDALPADSEPKAVQALIWYMGDTPLKLPADQHQDLNIYMLLERGWKKEAVFGSYIDPSAFYVHYLVIPFDPEEFAMRIINGSIRRGYRLDYRLDARFQAFADASEARVKRSN